MAKIFGNETLRIRVPTTESAQILSLAPSALLSIQMHYEFFFKCAQNGARYCLAFCGWWGGGRDPVDDLLILCVCDGREWSPKIAQACIMRTRTIHSVHVRVRWRRRHDAVAVSGRLNRRHLPQARVSASSMNSHPSHSS